MNGFVFPYQRGFELPEGCKDLMDVLRLPPQPEPVAASEGFADIEHYISLCTKSQSKRCALTICCWQITDRIPLCLVRLKGVLHAMIVVSCTNPLREQFVRAVFAERGIAATQDSLLGAAGDQSRLLAYPLPATPREAAALVSDLLQKAYRLSEDASLYFCLHEPDDS